MLADTLESLRAKLNAATPGEGEVVHDGDSLPIIETAEGMFGLVGLIGGVWPLSADQEAISALIVAMKNNLAALLDIAEAAQGHLSAIKQVVLMQGDDTYPAAFQCLDCHIRTAGAAMREETMTTTTDLTLDERAEKVLGYQRLPAFSTSIDAQRPLEEMAREKGWWFVIRVETDHTYVTAIHPDGPSVIYRDSNAPTEPEARLACLLKVLEGTK